MKADAQHFRKTLASTWLFPKWKGNTKGSVLTDPDEHGFEPAVVEVLSVAPAAEALGQVEGKVPVISSSFTFYHASHPTPLLH